MEAGEHGLFHTAKALHLDYGKLKQLLEAASPGVKRQVKRAPVSRWRRARSTAPPTFVELIAPRSGSFPNAEWSWKGRARRMRMTISVLFRGRGMKRSTAYDIDDILMALLQRVDGA